MLLKENEVIGTEGDTLEDLAAGREEKEDDEIMAAFASAAQPQQRNKPRDIKCKFMITDLSFHPSEERIAISNIEGEIFVCVSFMLIFFVFFFIFQRKLRCVDETHQVQVFG